MVNKKISELDPAATITGTEVVPLLQGGSTVAATVTQLFALIIASAPGNLDTFFEVATRLGLDEATVTTLQSLVAGKADTATTPTKTDLTQGYAAGAEYPYSLPAGVTLGHRYDPIHQAYNVTADTMRLWNAAKARTLAGGNPARVLTVGHSVVVGTSDSTPRWQYSFATKLRNLFNARYGSAGTGLVYLVTTALTDDARHVFTGTWTAALGTRGAFNAGCYNATGTANTYAFTPDIPVDSFNVYYVKNTVSGTFSASVDGGTASTANAFGSGTESIGVLTVPAGSLGTHTLTITPPASQQVYVVAVEGTVGTSGVRVSRCGRAGAFTSTITTAGTAGVDSLSTIFTSQAAPDLTVVMCEINDYNTNVPVTTFTTNLTTIVQRAQATGSVLVVVDETILTQPNAGGLYQSAYHAAIYSLADSLGFGVFDLASRWKNYATSSPAVPGFYANATADAAGIHPSAVGHQDIANGLFSIAAGDYNTPPAAPAAATTGTYLPEWQPNTAYTAGQYVLNPSGQVASANSTFTSGSSYTASNWTVVTTGGGSGTSLPSDSSISGFNAWSYDIAATAGTSTLSNQRFNVVRMMATGGTVTNLHVGVATAAAAPNAGVKMGIYDASGNLLGSTADIGTNLTTTGWKTLPLTSSVTVTAAQTIYVGLWWSGTTGPTIVRGSSPTTVQNAFAIGPVRFGFLTGQASLPASFTPASLSTETVDYWFAAS